MTTMIKGKNLGSNRFKRHFSTYDISWDYTSVREGIPINRSLNAILPDDNIKKAEITVEKNITTSATIYTYIIKTNYRRMNYSFFFCHKLLWILYVLVKKNFLTAQDQTNPDRISKKNWK
jgi:hypothetical protein